MSYEQSKYRISYIMKVVCHLGDIAQHRIFIA